MEGQEPAFRCAEAHLFGSTRPTTTRRCIYRHVRRSLRTTLCIQPGTNVSQGKSSFLHNIHFEVTHECMCQAASWPLHTALFPTLTNLNPEPYPKDALQQLSQLHGCGGPAKPCQKELADCSALGLPNTAAGI